MDRSVALIVAIFLLFLFTLLAYYGAEVTFISSLALALFISLVLLNIMYPPSQTTQEDYDFTLILYGVYEIVGIIGLSLYIIFTTLNDLRCVKC